MKPALILVACAVAILAVSSTARMLRESTSLSAIPQFIGAIFLIIVVLAHVAEESKLLPEMGWGQSDSPGHYVDLVSAIAGVVLLVIAVPLRWLGTERNAS